MSIVGRELADILDGDERVDLLDLDDLASELEARCVMKHSKDGQVTRDEEEAAAEFVRDKLVADGFADRISVEIIAISWIFEIGTADPAFMILFDGSYGEDGCNLDIPVATWSDRNSTRYDRLLKDAKGGSVRRD